MDTWALFVSHDCQICAEAEVRMQAAGILYERRFVTASPRPGMILVSPGFAAGEGAPEVECPVAAIPATPALWDLEQNELHVGLEAIESVLQAIAADAAMGVASCVSG